MKPRAVVNGALALALCLLAGIGWQWVHSVKAAAESDRWANHTHVVIEQLAQLLSSLKDAETGQRGFLIVGSTNYLEPYDSAAGRVDQELALLKHLTQDNPRQQQRLAEIESLSRAKLAELKQTIQLRRDTGFEAARDEVARGQGKTLMDQLRRRAAEATAEEAQLLAERERAKEAGFRKTSWIVGLGGACSLALLCTAVGFLKREITIRTQAEQELRRHKDHLEELVSERTQALAAREEEVRHQNEELQAQAEELSRQNEELQQQGEELEHQAEELQAQSEELQATNAELHAREGMLQTLLGSLRDAGDERQLMQQVCQALLQLVEGAATLAAVVEKEGERWLVRAHAGVAEPAPVALNSSLASLIMAEGRTAFIADLAQRPDLSSPQLAEQALRSVLATPLRLHGQFVGVVQVYSPAPREWTRQEFRLIEWAAAQCALALETTRLQQGLRQSEEQFRTLADSIPTLAWWAKPDGYITWYNRRWYEYTGTTPAQMAGWGWQRVHDPHRLPAVLERWKGAIAGGQPFEMEFPLRGADGHYRWFLTRAVPVRDAAGQVERWFGTNTDVSEAREAREVLTRSKAELEQLVAERTAQLQELVGELEHFSYTITHDMRAPLRAMRGVAEIINEADGEWSEQERQKFLRRIIVAAERMDGLITDALNYSKTVRQELPLAPIDIGKLLRGMLETYPEFQGADADIKVEGPLPWVIGNEAGLTQCFSNLLGNAVKFAKPGEKPVIRIRAEALQGERLGWARLWVEDNGVGVSTAMKPRVFEMFSRGSHPKAGTGIGLALVRKVVDRMGGRLGLDSEAGQGSRFWVELPVGRPADPHAAALTPGASEPIV